MDKELMEYFIEKTDERFDKLEYKIDKILEFKWQIIGGAVGISGLIGLVVNLFFNIKGG